MATRLKNNNHIPAAFKMSQSEYDKYLHILQSNQYNWKDTVQFLKTTRNGSFRSPRVVFTYGHQLLKNHFWSIASSEVWDIVEQVFYAALDCGQFHVADEYLSWMEKQFPGSTRVQRLRGVGFEARGEMPKAEEIYKNLLTKEPTDTLTLKRRIAVCTGLGKRDESIKLLNEYLSVFMGDLEAWAELSSLYLKENMYENAAFCYEELILAEPQNYHYYVKYAEILYTIGGLDNLLKALKYYSFALELQKENNLPALYGFILTVNTISSIKSSSLPKETSEAFEVVKTDILALHKDNPQLLSIVESTLSQLTPRSFHKTLPSAPVAAAAGGAPVAVAAATVTTSGGATPPNIQKGDKKGKKKRQKELEKH